MQTRRKVKAFYHDVTGREYEVVIGSNLNNPPVEDMLAIGWLISRNETQWFHLHLSEIKAIIAEHEKLLKEAKK